MGNQTLPTFGLDHFSNGDSVVDAGKQLDIFIDVDVDGPLMSDLEEQLGE